MTATLPVPKSPGLLHTAAGTVVRVARWLIPDRRDGVVVLALFLGVWLSNILGAFGLVEGANAAAAFHFAALNLVTEAENTVFVLLVARLTVGWSARGWRRHGLVALTMAAALLAQSFVHHRLALEDSQGDAALGLSFVSPSIPLAVAAVWFPLSMLLAAQFHRSHREREAAVRLRRLLSEVRGAQQRHAEARLRMLQSRIDPALLFGLLDRVRGLYEMAPERAEMLLEELIVFLRAVLPNLHNSTSTVGQEVAAADAYVRLRSLAGDEAASIDVEGVGVIDAPFPPGVLLPLVAGILQESDGRIALAVSTSTDGRFVELTLRSDAAPPDAALAKARLVLADLYGGRAELAFVQVNGGQVVRIRTPHEPGGTLPEASPPDAGDRGLQ